MSEPEAKKLTILRKCGFDGDETRVGIQGSPSACLLWVGRSDDEEDEERVAILSHKQIRKLIEALQATLPKESP